MSFKQCEADINALQQQITQFQAEYDAYINKNIDITTINTDTTDPNAILRIIQPVYNTATDIHHKLTAIEPIIHKFVVKARETDEDKQIYGAAQSKKIIDSNSIYEHSKQTFEPLYADIEHQYNTINIVCIRYNERIAAIEHAKQIEQQRIAAEHAAVQAEQQRIQTERDAIIRAEQQRLAAIEAQKQAEIQAERAAIERKLQRERDAQAKQQAEAEQQRLAAENERQQHLQAAADSQARQQHSIHVQQRLQEHRQQIEQIQSGVQSFTQNVELLIEHNSKDDSVHALQALLKHVNNVLNNPLDASYRIINGNDTVLQSTISSKNYKEQCMVALGFVPNNDMSQYELTASAEQWNTLQECKRALTKYITNIKMR